MRVELKPHPDTPCRAVASLEADVERLWRCGLKLTYVLRGELAAIRFPVRAEPRHVDGLWQTTCFEAFARSHGGEGYCEFNLSPSTEYATYGFAAYRESMEVNRWAHAVIATVASNERFDLAAVIDFQRTPQVDGDGPLQLGISAVIEEMDGRKSYWALRHPLGKPDFHHADGFALELP
ncbi:MAG: DOMON-like domain-containing protein [Caulobacteraceae bacterium]